MSRVSIAGVVLAGGMSRRMGGRDKALEMLAGVPLIGHVIDGIRRQVSDLALSVEQPRPRLAAFGLPQLADPAPGHRGPLSGLLSGLRHFSDRYPWVLLAPCDAPFLPADLGSKLLAGALEKSLPGAVAVYRGEWQPTFSIWHRSLLPEVERAVEGSGLGGFKQLMRTVNVAGCSWRVDEGSRNPPPFLNVNDPETLEEAGRWLRHTAGGALPCSA
jgi:molybdopterin-guanine dinucleotide biosynthesis protein A